MLLAMIFNEIFFKICLINFLFNFIIYLSLIDTVDYLCITVKRVYIMCCRMMTFSVLDMFFFSAYSSEANQ